MNKSVYLYELDSVRNSKEEIQYAQERMFREIILSLKRVHLFIQGFPLHMMML